MGKKLSEMTLEELWQLFPIFLVPHKDSWAAQYAREAERISAFLPAAAIVSHVGSTSVPGIWAKDIVDIMVELPAGEDMAAVKELIASNGYVCMWQEGEQASFNRGYSEQGFADEVFHLHLRRYGDNDELYFRDFLREHPDAAKDYEAMKLELWKRFEHNRNGYTDAKTEFIRQYTARAKALYAGRHDRAMRNS